MDLDLLRGILKRSETDNLDFKSGPYRFAGATDEEKAELLKDIVAMANAWKESPAYIVIGAEEVNGCCVATPGVAQAEILADHSVQQFVTSKVNRPIQFTVESVPFDGVTLNIITVASRQVRPILLKRDLGRLKANTVYIRRGSATVFADFDEVALMGRADAAVLASETAPNVAIEFAHPTERVKLGTTAILVSHILTERPTPPPTEQVRRNPNTSLTATGIGRLLRSVEPSRITIQMGPGREDWADFVRDRARFAGASFWVQNLGTKNVSNMRVEVRIAKEPDLDLVEQHELPEPPDSIRHYVPRLQGAFNVKDEGADYIIEFRPGTLQPKAEFWERESFYLACRERRTLQARVRIFADDLPNPLESILNLQLETEPRHITEAEIENAKKEHS